MACKSTYVIRLLKMIIKDQMGNVLDDSSKQYIRPPLQKYVIHAMLATFVLQLHL